MIPFEIEKLSADHIRVKSVTTALGGSMSVLDEVATEANGGKEVFTKVNVPLAIARNFIKQYGVAKYMTPVLCSAAFYDSHVVALERHPLGNLGEEVHEGLNGEVHWVSAIEKNIDDIILPYTRNDDWFIDGVFAYRFTNEEAEELSGDGKFRSVPVRAIKLANLSITTPETEERACIGFYAANGSRAVSPPIWKNLSAIGDRQLGRSDEDDGDESQSNDFSDFQFDRVDQFLSVNLSFALKAANELSGVFGYDIIEPLALDDLMIQLRTVNLPTVSKHVKRTFDTGMKFTHTIAWLIGLSTRVETLESYKVIRASLKYLTSKGVYRKTAFDPKAVYRDEKTMSDVPTMTVDEALEATKDDMCLAYVSNGKGTKKSEVNTVGTLYGAE